MLFFINWFVFLFLFVVWRTDDFKNIVFKMIFFLMFIANVFGFMKIL